MRNGWRWVMVCFVYIIGFNQLIGNLAPIPEPPKPVEPKVETSTKPKLKDDEAIIDLRCMKQLLQYAVRVGREGDLDEEEYNSTAKVCCKVIP